MKYDPLKHEVGKWGRRHPWFRKLLYLLLDLVLLRTWHIKREIRAIRPLLPETARILDAGSGFGQYLFYLSGLSRRWILKGVDVKEEQIADCTDFFPRAGRNHVQFEVADLTRFSEPRSYDLILSVDVMEHIEEDDAVFRNLYDALTDRGFLVLSTPSDQGGSDAGHPGGESFIGEHVRNGYSRVDITRKLQAAGFKEIDSKYSYGFPGHLSWVLSIKFPMLLLSISRVLCVVLVPYFAAMGVFILILNWFDTRFRHRSGTGLVVVARK
jgi:SAM-dependent methyltransferase